MYRRSSHEEATELFAMGRHATRVILRTDWYSGYHADTASVVSRKGGSVMRRWIGKPYMGFCLFLSIVLLWFLWENIPTLW